ncbi:MAG: response regulator [Burkholderiaceae bacterium]|nr:response regulator [Burkholderiaceae bacterium]
MFPSLKILVVEDNPDSQQMVCELIGMMGYTPSCAADGERALQLIQAQPFDVLLTDVSLPGMSGIALARAALGHQPALRIVFCTGYDKEALGASGIPASVLRKPYDLDELRAALEA